MKYLPLIWAGLWRKRLRTVLTLLSLVVAFLQFGLLEGVNGLFDSAVGRTQLNRLLVVSRGGFTEPLPISHLPRVEGVPGVSGATFLVQAVYFYQNPRNVVAAVATEPTHFFAIYPEFVASPDAIDALLRTRDGAIVGRDAAERYGWKVGDRIPLLQSGVGGFMSPVAGLGSHAEYTMVGTFIHAKDRSQERSMIVNYAFLDEARTAGKGTVMVIAAAIADPTQSADIARAIDARFANSPNETRTQSEKEFALSTLSQLGNINLMVNAIVGATLFAALFLTGNVMMQSGRERIAEFAVLKTLGFSDGAVVAIVLTEAILLCGTAAAIGLAGAAALYPLMASAIGATLSLAPWVVGWGAVGAVLLALISGVPPAFATWRLPIATALGRK